MAKRTREDEDRQDGRTRRKVRGPARRAAAARKKAAAKRRAAGREAAKARRQRPVTSAKKARETRGEAGARKTARKAAAKKAADSSARSPEGGRKPSPSRRQPKSSATSVRPPQAGRQGPRCRTVSAAPTPAAASAPPAPPAKVATPAAPKARWLASRRRRPASTASAAPSANRRWCRRRRRAWFPATASAARSGAEELRVQARQHTSSGPVLTAGDVDADWDAAESVGDEAPGGDNPTPDQDVVDEIGRALGVEYDDDEELQGGDEIAGRDRDRWELDPASSDDFDER